MNKTNILSLICLVSGWILLILVGAIQIYTRPSGFEINMWIIGFIGALMWWLGDYIIEE